MAADLQEIWQKNESVCVGTGAMASPGFDIKPNLCNDYFKPLESICVCTILNLSLY